MTDTTTTVPPVDPASTPAPPTATPLTSLPPPSSSEPDLVGRRPEPPLEASNDPADWAKGVSKEVDALGLRDMGASHMGAEAGAEATAKPAATDPAAPPPATETPEDILDGEKLEGDEELAEQLGKDTTPAWFKATIRQQREFRRTEAKARKDAEQRAADLQAKLEALQKPPEATPPEAEPSATPPAPPALAEPPARPKRTDFEAPDDYDAAVDQWAAARADWTLKRAEADATARRTQEQAAQQRAQQDQALRKLAEDWQPKRTAAIAAHPDWEKLVEGPRAAGEDIHPMTAATLMGLENGAEVAYQISKDPETLRRVAKMNPVDQVVEIKLLARELAKAPKIEVTTTPAPIRALHGGREVVIDANAEPSMEEVFSTVRERQAAENPGMWGHRKG